jgi:cytoskeletal protein RodZ
LEVPVENSPHRSLALPITILLLLVFAGGGFFGWKYYQKRAAEREAEQSAAIAKRVVPVQQPVAPPPASASQDPSASAATQPGNSPATTPATTTPSTAPAPETAAAPTSADGFEVQVKASQDSWISAKADGKSVLSGTLKAADAKTLRARDRIVLTLGNAAGVQVSYNGKDQAFDRPAGKVKTLVFTAQGLQPEAAEQR